MTREFPSDPKQEGMLPGGGHANHRRHIKDMPAILDVVTMVSNPVRYRIRYDLFRAFERMVADAGARLTVVEVAYGERPFEITEAGNPRHVQLRTAHELWHKENALNLGFERLPRDWQYASTVDADIDFARPDWVQETIHQLQHYSIVQMFSHAQDMGPNYEPLNVFNGFAANYVEGKPYRSSYYKGGGAGAVWHPGFAWAYRRDAFDALGGLIDFAILGAGDNHMARSLIGRGNEELPEGISPTYRGMIQLWQARAEQYIRRNIGYVPGTIHHAWHGRKADRGYWTRWKVLVDNGFDPMLDLKRDWQGLLQLTERSIGLRDGIRNYFRQRNEDLAEL